MASSQVMQSSVQSRWKQWWRRSSNTCCSKRVLLLLMWQMLFSSAYAQLAMLPQTKLIVLYISMYCWYFLAPLIGWLADVKFGRYKVIMFASFSSFLTSILYYIAMLTGGGNSTLSNVLLFVVVLVASFGSTCYSAAMLPFMTDQIIGATSDELSAVVRWYYWTKYVSLGFSAAVSHFLTTKGSNNLEIVHVSSIVSLAILLAAIIISDCLCQQWLDRTHKVTNPIKLIIQVLNYTRKHRYPERRSAFTYIDEEQPTQMDYGKEKFGGPFTEEEVEDVKTVLRLLPLVICLGFSVTTLIRAPTLYIFHDDDVQVRVSKHIIMDWLPPVILIPLYQLLLYRCFHSIGPSMLKCIGLGLFIWTLGYFLLLVLEVVGVIASDDVQRYLSCAEAVIDPGEYIEWYWLLDPTLFYCVGRAITDVLLYEFIIAQSPDKMKGLVIGISFACRGLVSIISFGFGFVQLTLCFDLSLLLFVAVLFVVFLVLSKCYTLRERNREINIQAIVEEHYERYLDQEEEYMRQPHY